MCSFCELMVATFTVNYATGSLVAFLYENIWMENSLELK